MAVRLNVIMVHSPPATAQGQRLAESVVGELIGKPGIDLTLVGPLRQIHDSSTDQLTLESISSDVAVLDWQAPGEVLQTLHSIGFPGQRWPHKDDPSAGQTTGNATPARKIFAYNLNELTDAKELCEALGLLLANRQVKTFSLDGPTQPPSNASTSAQPPKSSQIAAEAGGHSANSPASGPVAPHDGTSGRQSDAPLSINRPNIDLDDLVDQLDALDP